MRRTLSMGAAILAMTLLGVAVARAAGTPEIDRANAVFDLQPNRVPAPVTCPGEDGIKYTKYTGTWTGPETEVTPGFTDYNLTGSLALKKGVLTINQTTGRGVGTFTAVLTTAASGLKTYSGPLTLVLQQIDTPNGIEIQARGWLNAATFGPNGAKDGGSILANVEITFAPLSFAVHGVFGDAAPPIGVADYSVATANMTC